MKGEYEAKESRMQKVPQVDKLVGLRVRPSGFHASPPKLELRSKRHSKASIIKGRNESTSFES